MNWWRIYIARSVEVLIGSSETTIFIFFRVSVSIGVTSFQVPKSVTSRKTEVIITLVISGTN